jgi:hypothetical protein
MRLQVILHVSDVELESVSIVSLLVGFMKNFLRSTIHIYDSCICASNSPQSCEAL